MPGARRAPATTSPWSARRARATRPTRSSTAVRDLQVPAVRARRQQAQLRRRVRLLVPRDGVAGAQGPAVAAGSTSSRPATRRTSSGRWPWLPRCSTAPRFVFDHHDLCPELLRVALPRAARSCRTGGCCALERAHVPDRGPRDLHQRVLPRRSPSTRGGKAAARRDGRPHRPGPATAAARPSPTPSCAAAAGTWSPTSASWARRTASTSWCAAADIVVHELGRDDIAFTLIGAGDCFDELVALRDELGLQRLRRVHRAGRPTSCVTRRAVHRRRRPVPGPEEPAQRRVDDEQDDGVHGLRAAGRRLRPAGDPGVGGRRRGLRRAQRRSREYAEAIVGLLDDEPQRRAHGQARPASGSRRSWPGPTRKRAYLGVYDARCSAERRTRDAGEEPDMCGIAGCYQQPDGHKLADIMIDRIAHRGPDAGGVWSHADDRVVGPARPPPAVDHRPVRRGRPAVRQGRPDAGLQRRAVQLPGAAARAGGRGVALRHQLRHRGRARGLAALGHRRPAAVPRHVRVRAVRRADRRACSWPATRSASSRCTTCQRGDGVAVRLRAEGARRRGRARAADRAGRAGRVDALLLGARAALRDRGRAQAARPAPGPGSSPDGQLAGRALLAASRTWPREAAARPAPDLAPVIEESVAAHLVADVPVSSFLSGGLDSSIITVLAHRRRPGDRRLHDHLPARGPAARGHARRRASTPARSRRSSASSCTRSRSRRTSSTCCPGWWTSLDEPIGDPAAINTLLMCEAARDRGVKVMLSGMGADELFGGYRKHLACLLASRYRPAARPRAGRAVRSAVDRLPVSRRRPRPALRALGQALPDLRRAARGDRGSGAATRCTTRTSWPACSSPDLRRPRRRRASTSTRAIYTDNDLRRPGQPDVPGRHAAVPARAQPHLHRPGQHGRLGRGARAVRRPGGGPGGVRDPGPRTRSAAGSGKAGAQAGRRALAAAARSCTGPRPRSALRCGPGCATTCGTLINDVLVGGELVGSGMLRRDALRRLIADERAGREDSVQADLAAADPGAAGTATRGRIGRGGRDRN